MNEWNIPQKYLDQSEEIARLTAELESARKITRQWIDDYNRLRQANKRLQLMLEYIQKVNDGVYQMALAFADCREKIVKRKEE